MQNKNKTVIGVTGGIGSGKSLLLTILERDYGAFIIQTDQIARQLQDPGEPGYQALVEAFGTDILSSDQTLNREYLANLIFRDQDALNKVNRMIHPLVWRRVKELINSTDRPLIVLESALLSEKPDDICDELWYLYTSRAVRIKRLMESRGYSREKAEMIMSSQPSEQQFKELADHIILNDGTVAELESQIKKLL